MGKELKMKNFLKYGVFSFIVIIIFAFCAGTLIYYFFPGILIKSNIDKVRKSANLTRNEIKINDHKWVYLDNKNKSDKTIVLIHGFGLNKDFWGSLPKEFSKDYRLVIPDMPGFGESEYLKDADYTLPKQTERLAQFINALNLKNITLAGCSMGGAITTLYALNFSENLKNIILIGAFGAATEDSDFDKQIESGNNPMFYTTPEGFDNMSTYSLYKPMQMPKQFKKLFADDYAKKSVTYRKIFDQMFISGKDFLIKELTKIKVPALIIWGKNERMINLSAGENFHKGLKNSRLVIIDKASHLVYIDQPEKTAAAISEFLSGK
jgi:abhydrolase domain-containing protein 6